MKATTSVRRKSEEDRPIRMGKPRAALVVYRLVNGRAHFLLISAANNPDKWTLPGGKVGRNETACQAAIRETVEEAGALIDDLRQLGRYLHRKQGQRYHPTQTYLAKFVGQLREHEDRDRHWIHADELDDGRVQLRKPIRKQLERAALVLRQNKRAAA